MQIQTDIYISKPLLINLFQVDDIEGKFDLFMEMYKEDRRWYQLQHQHLYQNMQRLIGRQNSNPTIVEDEMTRGNVTTEQQLGKSSAGSSSCLRRGASDSEPGTPTVKNPDRPMQRNLSDLGPRVKKRVTYRSSNAVHLSDRDRPPSLTDMSTPPTPILKRTLHQHIPVEPDIKESHTFGGSGESTSSDIFSSTSALLPNSGRVRHGRHSDTTNPSTFCAYGQNRTSSQTTQESHHLRDHVSSYFDTTIDVQTTDDSDSQRSSTAGFRRSSNTGGTRTTTRRECTITGPLSSSQRGHRRQTTSSFNSSESELVSDMEEGALLSDECGPSDSHQDVLTSSQNSVFELETSSDESHRLQQSSARRSTSSDIIPNHSANQRPLLDGDECHERLLGSETSCPVFSNSQNLDEEGTELNTFRMKPESKAFLMRPEVLKLKKTSC